MGSRRTPVPTDDDYTVARLVGCPILLGWLPARYVSHLTIISLILFVAAFGNTLGVGQSLEELPARAGLAQIGHPGSFASDTLVKPAVPATRAVNRPRQGSLRHTVVAGETVDELAQRFDVTVNTILWANRLPPGAALMPGQTLVILPVSGILHTVKDGDTLDYLAQRYESDPPTIADFNQLADLRTLNAGDEIIIPGGRQPEPERPVLASRAISRPTPRPQSQEDPAAGEPARPLAAEASDEVVRGEVARPVSAEPQPLRPIEYRVAEGDTLFAIAGKFGVSAESIVSANKLHGKTDQLSIGQLLVVPPVSGVLHKVGPGDTIEAIATRYGASIAEVVRANALREPFVIRPDQDLIVPGGKEPEPAPVVLAAPAPRHVVREGESVVAVAERFGVEVLSVIRANALREPFTIQPGQELIVPGGKERAPAAIGAARPAPRPVAAPAPTPVPTPAPKPAPAPPPSSAGWNIVGIASKFLGYRYVWGGTSPAGFDCTGFVMYVYRQAGIYLPRDMWGQLQSGRRISRDSLLPGDIVFFVNTYAPGLTHNGIYIGGGRFINAASERLGVIVSGLNEPYWNARYYAGSRPW
ncbi:MAG: LysM peptidoglycan-binding domain-containing protein [Chloroflexi bacterium]|nr:LysM peptidoglycan-binding domain-containing protein [Chloroflexota bacterium]